MDELDGKLPLGLCKQVALKFESAISDIYEILEDPDLTEIEKENFKKMAEVTSLLEAHLINIISRECEEDVFLNEDVPMDEIGTYPGDDIDIMDSDI